MQPEAARSDPALPALAGEAVAQRRALDRLFRDAALRDGAVEREFPPLLEIAALERADYFRSFPQHASLIAPLERAVLPEVAAHGARGARALASADLATPRHLMTPAACYALYPALADRALAVPCSVTLVSDCCRHEADYDAGVRQWCFRMRETVHFGTAESVRACLATWTQRILAWGAAAGLQCSIAPATDSFFDPQDPRRLLQRLEPNKHEVLWDGRIALASLNFHRTFFGERYGIRDADGRPVFSGCVAFGLDRWLLACRSRCGERLRDWPAVLRGGSDA
jgi:seryl-tRNA synthetase